MDVAQKKMRLEMMLPWGAQTALARKMKVSQSAIHLVFRGKSKSKRIEEAIAKELGISREEFLRIRDNVSGAWN